MKKVCFFILLIIVIIFIIMDHPNYALRKAIRYGNEISKKIQTLYNKKSQDLNIYNDKLTIWLKGISDKHYTDPFYTMARGEEGSWYHFYTIARDEEGSWYYFTEDYKRVSFEFEDKFLDEGISNLFEEYDVDMITMDDDGIKYFISEDALIYSVYSIEEKAYTVHIEGNWYHFRFPYGI